MNIGYIYIYKYIYISVIYQDLCETADVYGMESFHIAGYSRYAIMWPCSVHLLAALKSDIQLFWL